MSENSFFYEFNIPIKKENAINAKNSKVSKDINSFLSLVIITHSIFLFIHTNIFRNDEKHQ